MIDEAVGIYVYEMPEDTGNKMLSSRSRQSVFREVLLRAGCKKKEKRKNWDIDEDEEGGHGSGRKGAEEEGS